MAEAYDREQVVISFGTPIAEANADAVAAMLRAFVSLVEAANKEVKADKSVLVRVRPPEEGSFELPCELTIAAVGATLLPRLPLIHTVLQLVKAYFEIRLLAKGKPLPQPNANGDVVLGNKTEYHIQNSGTFNVLNSPEVNRAVGEAATAIERDETINNVRLLQGEGQTPLIAIDREALAYLKSVLGTPPLEVPPPRVQAVEKATLILGSPVFIGARKWVFTYRNHSIEANVQDQDFLLDVQTLKHEFNAATRITADLLIDEEYDVGKASYMPSRYTVVKVHRVKKLQHQLSLQLGRSKAKANRKAKPKPKGKGKRKRRGGNK